MSGIFFPNSAKDPKKEDISDFSIQLQMDCFALLRFKRMRERGNVCSFQTMNCPVVRGLTQFINQNKVKTI